MNQGDRYRRRNRLDRRAEGRFRRWIPVALFAALLALLLWFPLRDQQGGLVLSGNESRSMAQQVVKEHTAMSEGADSTETSETTTQSDSLQETTPGFRDGASGGARTSEGVEDEAPDPVVINSSAEGVNTYSSDEIAAADAERTAVRAVEAFGGVLGIEGLSKSFPSLTDRPITGFIFEAKDQGGRFQLIVVAPNDADAFVKLKDPLSTETVLSFYVRSGGTVEAYVPEGVWELSYALGPGSEWNGFEEKFGDKGTYWKSDRELDFTNPKLLTCTYTLGSDGNVKPVAISRAEFV